MHTMAALLFLVVPALSLTQLQHAMVPHMHHNDLQELHQAPGGAQLVAVPVPSPNSAPCKSDLDCSLNGSVPVCVCVCVVYVCVCVCVCVSVCVSVVCCQCLKQTLASARHSNSIE